MNIDPTRRKPGRPRAIPASLIPVVLSMYCNGLGYRAISRELLRQGISADWSTVRRMIKEQNRGNYSKERTTDEYRHYFNTSSGGKDEGSIGQIT